MNTFWWLRHAPTHAKRMVGWSDVPADLSDTAALDRLAAYLPADALVVSSDLVRASATADAIAAGRLRLAHDERLRELNFGVWDNLTFAEIEARNPKLAREFYENPGDIRAPGGESWNELSARVQAVVSDLTQQHPGHDIVVVAHMAVILTQLQRAMDVDAVQALAQTIDNLSLTRIAPNTTAPIGPVNQIV